MAEVVLCHGSYTIKAGYADVIETTLLPSIETPSKVKRRATGGGGGQRATNGIQSAAVKTNGADAAPHDGTNGNANENGRNSGATVTTNDDNGDARRSSQLHSGTSPQVSIQHDVNEVIGRRGRVLDWDGLEVIWDHLLYEMLGWIKGEEGNVLLSEPLGMARVCEAIRVLLFHNHHPLALSHQIQLIFLSF